MTPFVDCKEFIFRGTFIILLIAAFGGVICFAISISYKLKLRYILPELLCTIGAILMFLFLSDSIEIRDFGKNRIDFSSSICFWPVWSIVLISFFLLISIGICLLIVIKKRLSSLTAMSIKDAISVLPVGVCFYDKTGRLLLMNKQIDDECREITGMPLCNGEAFWSAMCEKNTTEGNVCTLEGNSILVEKNNGKASCYKQIIHVFNGETIYEISGSDISYEYALKKKVETQNEELRKMNVRLHNYGETVNEVTKEREILAARVKIHDRMGSLILKTKKALSQGEYDKESLFDEWNRIVSLIYAPEVEEDKRDTIRKMAESIGVKIIYTGVFPKRRSTAEKILANAISECVINTARHADGDAFYIHVIDDGKFYIARLTNNGKPPLGKIVEGGGLSSLRTMIEMARGSMEIKSEPRFLLTIRIPKEEKEDE